MVVIFDGSLFQWIDLQNQQRLLSEKSKSLHEKQDELKFKIQQTRQTTFIRRLAHDQLDMVEEGDLLFIFSD